MTRRADTVACVSLFNTLLLTVFYFYSLTPRYNRNNDNPRRGTSLGWTKRDIGRRQLNVL